MDNFAKIILGFLFIVSFILVFAYTMAYVEYKKDQRKSKNKYK
jgi:CBS domain containing-hemolysin-like protein